MGDDKQVLDGLRTLESSAAERRRAAWRTWLWCRWQGVKVVLCAFGVPFAVGMAPVAIISAWQPIVGEMVACVIALAMTPAVLFLAVRAMKWCTR